MTHDFYIEKYYGPIYVVGGTASFATCLTCGAAVHFGEDMVKHFSWHGDTDGVEVPK